MDRARVSILAQKNGGAALTVQSQEQTERSLTNLRIIGLENVATLLPASFE